MSSTEVSVIVPAFNAGATIDATLASVRRQTHAALDIVIVDDGSRDDTAARAAAHAADDRRIRIVRQDNAGVAAARNAGLAAARAEFVAPIDADDLWAPTKIAKQLARIAGRPEIGLVYTWYKLIDDDGRVMQDSRRFTDEGDVCAVMAFRNLVGNGSGGPHAARRDDRGGRL
jgi:glycosyltransferase involved in cell wall biosynthesis